MIVATALEAPAVVSGLDDVAVVGQPIEHRGRHLGPEDARPFTEGQVGGDDDRSTLVEPADEVRPDMTDHVINWDDWNESVRRDLYWCAEELLSQVPDAIIRLAVSSCASRDAVALADVAASALARA